MVTKYKVNNKQSNFAELVMSTIKSGLWCSNDRLMSERMLAEKFKLSRTTVRESLKTLLELGVITREGRYTYIHENALNVIESLRHKSDHRLVVVLKSDHMDNPLYKIIFNAVVTNLEQLMQVRVMFLEYYPESIANVLTAEDIVLFLGKCPEKQIQAALSCTSNVILVNSCHRECHYVMPDNYLGGRLMAEHLYMNGHTRIGAVFLSSEINSEFSDRFMGARNYLQEHDIELQEMPQIERISGENDISLFQRGFLKMWEEIHPTSIICQRDGVALSLYELLSVKGVNIPEELSIVGFDDQVYSSYAMVPLTTVRYPTEAIGMEVIGIVKQILAGKTELVRKKIEPRLFRRESVKSIGERKTANVRKRELVKY